MSAKSTSRLKATAKRLLADEGTADRFFDTAREIILDVLEERHLLPERRGRSSADLANILQLLSPHRKLKKQPIEPDTVITSAENLLRALDEFERNSTQSSSKDHTAAAICFGIKLSEFLNSIRPAKSPEHDDALIIYREYIADNQKEPTETEMLAALRKRKHYLCSAEQYAKSGSNSGSFGRTYNRWRKRWRFFSLIDDGFAIL